MTFLISLISITLSFSLFLESSFFSRATDTEPILDLELKLAPPGASKIHQERAIQVNNVPSDTSTQALQRQDASHEKVKASQTGKSLKRKRGRPKREMTVSTKLDSKEY